MYHHLRKQALRWPGALACLVLLTVGAAWLWAHEGHEPLPTRGARTLKDRDGRVVGVVLSSEARQALGLGTAPVEKRALEQRFVAYASLTAPWQAHAFATSRLPGRIVRLHVRPGERVKAGQVLADVQCPELETLQQELLTARADVRLSEKHVEALTESYRRGATPEQNLTDARTRHQQNRNTLEVARSKWLNLGLSTADLDRLLGGAEAIAATLPVRSPVSGTVIHADISIGKVVEPAEHLFEVVDLSTVWVRIGVLERDRHRVRLGQEVELRFPAYPDEVFRTRIGVLGLHLDERTHLHTVWAELTNPPGEEPRFLPGLNGEAELIVPAESAGIVVPVSAVIHDGVEHYVLVEGSNTPEGSEYLRTPIAVGRRTAAWVEVLAGDVFPGGHVVTQGSHELAAFFIPGVLRLSPEARRDIGLRVEEVKVQPVDAVASIDASVEVPPERRAVLAAQLGGTLHSILVERGQRVEAGQEVARVASLELLNQQLELLRTHLEAQLVEETWKRLRSATSLPVRMLWEVESRLTTLRHQREGGRRRLRALGLSDAQLAALLEQKKLVEHVPIRAPIAGRVVKFDRVLGQAVKADEALFEVHDLEAPLLQGHVSEADLVHVRVGQRVRVGLTADPGFAGEATVVRNARVLGTDNRTLSIWARLDRQPQQPLLHNQLARLTLLRGRAATGLTVPRTAVVREGTRAFVFLERSDGTFERRAVALGVEDDRRVIIETGLSGGEKVVVAGAGALHTAHAAIR